MFKMRGEDLEWEYEPNTGNVGRGFRKISPAEVSEIFLYKPYLAPACGGMIRDVPILEDPGWVWNGYIREENGKHFIIAFERPADSAPFVIPERPSHYWSINDLPEGIREDFKKMMSSGNSPIVAMEIE